MLILPLVGILLFGCINTGKQNPALILNNWKVNLGDSAVWANANFNDSDWENYDTQNKNRNNIFRNYDGYAWYRTMIIIPSKLKENTYNKDSLSFFLGIIDDCDQVYLNGYLLGENNITEKEIKTTISNFKIRNSLQITERNYVIASSDKRIFWNKPNSIAIRVFDQGNEGGLMCEKPTIAAVGLNNYVKFDKTKFYKADSIDYLNGEPINRDLLIKNVSTTTVIEGGIIIKAKNMKTKSQVYDERINLALNPKSFQRIKIHLPVTTELTVLEIKFKDKHTDFVIQETDTIPFVLE